jgi:hypothetical protein
MHGTIAVAGIPKYTYTSVIYYKAVVHIHLK